MTIGVLGGGQLARMLALAAHPLGVRIRVYEPEADPPAAAVAEHVRGEYDDADRLDAFARGLAVATYEFENVPETAAARVASAVPLRPSIRGLVATQDRVAEKRLLRDLDVPTTAFSAVDDGAGVDDAVARVGLPAVWKARRHGYDGRGQMVVRTREDARAAWAAFGRVPLVAERLVEFRRELSLVCVRGLDGDVRFYPLVENQHADGILRTTLAPADAAPALRDAAEAYAHRVLHALDYVGVLTLEMFDTGTGLLVNELAPRVHNSGHWTIEGAVTSQFANHVRAILGLPLGSTAPFGPAVMVNLIGALPAAAALLALPDTHLHLYGKAPRPKRKLGHVTARAVDVADRARRRDALERLVAAGAP